MSDRQEHIPTEAFAALKIVEFELHGLTEKLTEHITLHERNTAGIARRVRQLEDWRQELDTIRRERDRMSEQAERHAEGSRDWAISNRAFWLGIGGLLATNIVTIAIRVLG